MVVTNTMGAGELVRKYLESEAGSELLAEMVKMAAELLMDAEVDVLCGAGYGERSEARLNSRNGHRGRRWDTRAGTVTLDVPKLRRGSYFPSLLEPRRRALDGPAACAIVPAHLLKRPRGARTASRPWVSCSPPAPSSPGGCADRMSYPAGTVRTAARQPFGQPFAGDAGR